MEFVLGQRWVSQTESELGLGIVIDVEGRHITVRFPVAEEDRVYALNNAPLARVIYQVGETLFDQSQTPRLVTGVEDLDGLKCYLTEGLEGDEQLLPETQISGLVHLSSPRQRLLSGQIDKSNKYELRVATLLHRYQLESGPARGMLGSRTSLLPHQVYIAHEVARRFAPRVLLADEVGLGKTIEAGMILHHQLQSGLASRVLIVVPDALLHQWLVEMLRKFGLRFALFDRERFDALYASEEANPFETEQLVLCPLSIFIDSEDVTQAAIQAGWDLLVVDEAHHLQWSAEAPSGEYLAVQALAEVTPGLLLLTATPEQLGVASHFARLRLLDPSRFNDLQSFKDEQEKYVQLNEVVHQLQSKAPLSEAQQVLLDSFVDVEHGPATPLAAVVEQLLDQHGTGRVLFRNTRAAISGFPQRQVHGYALPKPDSGAVADPYLTLHPELERASQGVAWLSEDPRVAWLESFFASHKQDKVLLICAAATTAVDLERHLHLNVGVRSAAFYEDLSIVERDRAAAYFADEEAGAQALICSEIGSEGRNFQFAHHLVLFDLPINPDLLEQRIGRLDRIGQQQDIQIHVPYIEQSAQAVLYRWYNDGLDGFCHSFSAGAAVYEHFADDLAKAMSAQALAAGADYESLISQTAEYTQALRLELQQGRDQLLELNSCNTAVASQIIAEIESAANEAELQDYMMLACDTFGVESEYHSEHSLVLKPSEQMLTDSFPFVPEDGLTVTFDRDRALVREDMEFLTWESPIVGGVMEMVLGSPLGNTNVSTIQLQGIPAGTLLVECYFAMQCSAPKRYQVGRFLPATPVRVVLDSNGRDLSKVIKHEQLNKLCRHIKKSMRPAIIKEIRGMLVDLLNQAQDMAEPQQAPLQQAAYARVEQLVGGELARLQHLQTINPSIRSEEIEFFAHQQKQVSAYIAQAALEPQAARVIITT